jgi:electron transport complex protein RnfB
VACMNEDKGGLARKYCAVACTGCTLCFKVCPFEAITMGTNLALIDSEKCRLCRKCVPVCPTNAIIEIGFPPRKEQASPEPASGSTAENPGVSGKPEGEKDMSKNLKKEE